jgi:sodium-dependent phosphate cotransporter
MVMGANMGTSVTNTVVSFGHVVRKKEFKRALAASTIDDFFNILSAAFFLPLELLSREVFKPWLGGKGLIESFATFAADSLAGVGAFELVSPVKILIVPVADAIEGIVVSFGTGFSGLIVLLIAFVTLVFSLKSIVSVARRVAEKAEENFINTHLFNSPRRAFTLGLFLTSTIQSSSITLSLIVPLVGAGMLSLEQVFPYALGSDVGTTITAIIAALGLASTVEKPEFARAALTIALFHFTYNSIGAMVFYPLRRLPIGMAKKLADFTSEQPARAVAYVIFFFYVIPILYIVITRMIGV